MSRAAADATSVAMPFGKHKGKDLEDVPSSYLRWLAGEVNQQQHAELLKAAEAELKFRTKFDGHFE